MKAVFVQDISNCSECFFYQYVSCYGKDCMHPDAPDKLCELEDEPLAENRKGNFPKWCPFITKGS